MGLLRTEWLIKPSGNPWFVINAQPVLAAVVTIIIVVIILVASTRHCPLIASPLLSGSGGAPPVCTDVFWAWLTLHLPCHFRILSLSVISTGVEKGRSPHDSTVVGLCSGRGKLSFTEMGEPVEGGRCWLGRVSQGFSFLLKCLLTY